MSKDKKKIRENFRDSVFKRDKFRCVMCGLQATPQNVNDILDCHHITNRNKMPNGGYVKENGISLCKDKCHLLAEEVEQGLATHSGFEIHNLYSIVESSYDKAIYESNKLK